MLSRKLTSAITLFASACILLCLVTSCTVMLQVSRTRTAPASPTATSATASVRVRPQVQVQFRTPLLRTLHQSDFRPALPVVSLRSAGSRPRVRAI